MAALGRWKRFLASFDHIDAAIEAADQSLSRDEFRRMRLQIVEMLCGLEDDDVAAEFRVILDEVMAESLLTLQSVPEDAVPRILASTAGLAATVGALRSHDSGRVCGLARDLISGWKAAVEVDIVRMTATIAQLDALSASSQHSPSHVVSSDGTKKLAPGASDPSTMKTNPTEKMEATKRKLHESYQEAADAKRRRTIRVIEAPKSLEQKQRKMHPIMRERSRQRCGDSTVRRSLSSFHRV